MSNPSKAKGTAAESAVVGYLRKRGWFGAERRALAGNKDLGDVTGIPDLVIEVKACRTMDLAGWLREAAVERSNADATTSVVYAKKRGTTDVAEWYAITTVEQHCDLLAAAGYGGNFRDLDGLISRLKGA